MTRLPKNLRRRAADTRATITIDDDGEQPGRCPTCHGAGGWQQPDGLIIECPRGCMAGDR